MASWLDVNQRKLFLNKLFWLSMSKRRMRIHAGRAGLFSREALLTDFTHRFCGVFWLFPHGPGLARFEVGGVCECVRRFHSPRLQQRGYEWENRKGFYGPSHGCHWNQRSTERWAHGHKGQKRIASWESPTEQNPSLRERSRMVAHQCDINGDQQSHLCAYIWYLINKNKMRLSFTLKEWNLTSPHKQPIDNCAGLRHRGSLGTVWKGWSVTGHIGCPDVRVGILLYFPYLQVGKLSKLNIT